MPLGVGLDQNVGLRDFFHILTLLPPGASVFHKHMSCLVVTHSYVSQATYACCHIFTQTSNMWLIKEKQWSNIRSWTLDHVPENRNKISHSQGHWPWCHLEGFICWVCMPKFHSGGTKIIWVISYDITKPTIYWRLMQQWLETRHKMLDIFRWHKYSAQLPCITLKHFLLDGLQSNSCSWIGDVRLSCPSFNILVNLYI